MVCGSPPIALQRVCNSNEERVKYAAIVLIPLAKKYRRRGGEKGEGKKRGRIEEERKKERD